MAVFSFNMRYFIEYFFAEIITLFAAALPMAGASALAARLGDLYFLFNRRRRRIALENITRAFGDSLSPDEKKKLALRAFRNTAIALMELYVVPAYRRKAPQNVRFSGLEHLDGAFARGKGVIYAISHLGAWEYLAMLPYLKNYPCSVVVKTIKNPHLNRKTNELRRLMDLNPIPKKNSAKTLLKELKENHLVAILMDQWAGQEGLWIDFFGSPTSTTSIPARLAKKTGAAIVPAFCVREAPGKYHIVNLPEVKVAESENWEAETTLALNRILEGKIRKYPEQWIWGHNRWKKRPLKPDGTAMPPGSTEASAPAP